MTKQVIESKEHKLAYSTAELGYHLSTNEHRIGMLRDCGALVGIKNGNKFIYSRKEVERFLEDFQGYNLQTETDIKLAVAEVNRKKAKYEAKTSRI